MAVMTPSGMAIMPDRPVTTNDATINGKMPKSAGSGRGIPVFAENKILDRNRLENRQSLFEKEEHDQKQNRDGRRGDDKKHRLHRFFSCLASVSHGFAFSDSDSCPLISACWPFYNTAFFNMDTEI